MEYYLPALVTNSIIETLKKKKGSQLFFQGISQAEVIEAICNAFSSYLRNNLDEFRIHPIRLNRTEAAAFLDISCVTLDTYTEKGMFVKYGYGKRARYFLHEIQVAKAKYFPGDLTRKEAAYSLDISSVTLDRYVREGRLNKYGAGRSARFDKREVEALSVSRNKR